jgi:hypothetical protein
MVSCKKSDETEQIPFSNWSKHRIKTWTSGSIANPNSYATKKYFYDPEDSTRLVSIILFNSAGAQVFTDSFAYPKGKNYFYVIHGAGLARPAYTDSVIIDDDRTVLAVYSRDVSSGQINRIEQYTYNSNKQLMHATQSAEYGTISDLLSSFVYEWEDGNAVRVKDQKRNSISVFSYDMSKGWQPAEGSELNNLNRFGGYARALRCRNMLSNYGPGEYYDYIYNYTFDTEGRITSLLDKSGSSGDKPPAYTITYY